MEILHPYWTTQPELRVKKRKVVFDWTLRLVVRPVPPPSTRSAFLRQQRCVTETGLLLLGRPGVRANSNQLIRTGIAAGLRGCPGEFRPENRCRASLCHLRPSSSCRISSSGSYGSAVWPGRWAGSQGCHVRPGEGPRGPRKTLKIQI